MHLIPQLSIQKEEAKKKEVHVEENVPAPSPRSNCTVMLLSLTLVISNFIELALLRFFSFAHMIKTFL
jgi:hypothetical protein